MGGKNDGGYDPRQADKDYKNRIEQKTRQFRAKCKTPGRAKMEAKWAVQREDKAAMQTMSEAMKIKNIGL